MARAVTGMPVTAARRAVGRTLLRRWHELAARERGMLLLMALAIGGAGVWVGWWEPLQKQRLQLRSELPRLREQQQALLALFGTAQRQRRAAVVDAATLRDRLRASGLDREVRLAEVQGQWRLTVQDAPADTLWNWLLPVLADPAAPLQELTLERTGDPNMAAARVSGRIVVGRGGSDGGGR